MTKNLSGKTLGFIHAAVFTATLAKKYTDEIIPEVAVMHMGDDTIQRDNMKAPIGTIPPHNFAKFTQYAKNLEDAGCDMIMLGCSTFNPAVEHARPMIGVPLLQIDRPMMDLAVQQGKKVGLLATLAMTVPSSERLLRKAAADAGKEIDVKTVLSTAAFEALMAGKPDQHNEILIQNVRDLAKEVDAIVMAQLSMSVLEPMLTDIPVPVYNSGRTGVTRAREMLEAM